LEARNLSVLHCLCSGPNYQLGVSSLVGRVNLGFGSLRTLEGKSGLLGKRTLLSIVWTYGGGPPDVRSANCTGRRMWDHRTYATFWNTFWLIPECTRQPLNCWVRTTRRTPFGRTSAAFWAYKYPLPSSCFAQVSDTRRLPKCS
jgi:hypothetical protein